MKFERHYAGRAINWSGNVVRVSGQDEESSSFAHHVLSILVKMHPDDKENDDVSLGLSFSHAVSEKYQNVISELNRGDEITFNATLVTMGDTRHIHHMHCFGIEKGPGFMEISPHVHDSGRYKFIKSGEPAHAGGRHE